MMIVYGWRLLTAAATAALLCGMASCGEPPEEPATSPKPAPSATTSPPAEEPNPPSTSDDAPKVEDFTLPDVRGRMVNLTKFVAGRPFVLMFGTTSCPYCVLQIKTLKDIKKRFGEDVAILTINVGEPASRVAAYVERIDSPFTTLNDGQASVYLRYGQGSVPLTIVADQSRRVIGGGGYIPADRLTRMLRQALESET